MWRQVVGVSTSVTSSAVAGYLITISLFFFSFLPSIPVLLHLVLLSASCCYLGIEPKTHLSHFKMAIICLLKYLFIGDEMPLGEKAPRDT